MLPAPSLAYVTFSHGRHKGGQLLDKKQTTIAMQERLRLSGLPPETAKKLAIQPFSTDDAAALGLSHHVAGFKIPYFEPSGKVNGFYRYRTLEAPKASFGALAKPPKYLQPPKSQLSVYLPPINGADWVRAMRDTDEDILITEGELKAAAATQAEFYTVGLGGVWSFRSSKTSAALLPLLEAFDWHGRRVYIVFDSDAALNPDILRAESALSRELDRRGALVAVARLPELPGQAKTGLDDFLRIKNADALAELLEQSEPYSDARELHRLNEEVTYIRNPGFVVRLDNLQTMSPDAFMKHQYATRRLIVTEKTAKGTKLVEKSAACEWIKWGGRSQAERMTYQPGAGHFVDGNLNAWSGWGVEPTPGDVGPWKTLLDKLFGKDKGARNYFEKWCACPLQQPGIKMFVAAVIWAVQQGIGKSAIGYTLKRIYGENAAEINEKHLSDRDNFNDWQKNKQFVFGDDVASSDKRALASVIKNMISQEEVWINIKHVPKFSIPDVMNYYFTSNHPDAFFLDDGDRRFFIHNPKDWPTPEWFRAVYVPWMKGDGPSHLFHHLLHLDLTGFEPHAPAMSTEDKRAMISAGQSALGAWVRDLRDTPENVLRAGNIVLPWTLATTKDLLDLYDPTGRTGTTVNRMASELAKVGFKMVHHGRQIPLSTQKKERLWVVRHKLSVTNPKAAWLAKIYESEHLISKE